MKRVLTLQLHRTPDGANVKDGGPVFARGIINAFKEKGYQVDSLSGNTVPEEKWATSPSPFIQRIHKAKFFAEEIKRETLEQYDLLLFFHPSTLMGFEVSQLPLEKTILFPSLLGVEYRNFMEVPDEYIKLEKKVLSYGYTIIPPSKAQSTILIEEYGVSKEYIISHVRGFDSEVFRPKERSLRNNISAENPFQIVSANAVRPQKGYKEFLDFVLLCKQNKLPIKLEVFGDMSGTNLAYKEYAEDFIKEIQEQELQKYIEIHPAQPQELLAQQFEKMDAAVIPSIYESFGKSALEASASGLPTIVFEDIPAYAEFLDINSAMFVERNPKYFFQKLKELMSDSDLYGRLSRGGIDNGKNYVATAVYSHLATMIEERAKKFSHRIRRV